jgi:hypothetical protein
MSEQLACCLLTLETIEKGIPIVYLSMAASLLQEAGCVFRAEALRDYSAIGADRPIVGRSGH